MKVPAKLEDITLEWFNTIFKAHDIKVHEFRYRGEMSNGRGMMGSLEEVELEISRLSGDNETRDKLDIVLKTLPQDEFRKSYCANDGFCSREVCMYTEIFKVWDEFLDSRKVPQECRFRHPICYYGAEEGHRDSYRYILVLENLLSKKNGPDQLNLWQPGFFEPLPWAATETVIRQIARFHATGLAYKMHTQVEYTKKFPSLNHVVNSMFPMMWKNGFDVTKTLIQETIDAEDVPEGVLEQLDKLKGDEARNLLLKWFTDSALFKDIKEATVCHHDLHSNNLVLNQDYSQVVLFDYQASCLFNPMKDLSFFLVLNCEYDVAGKNLSKVFEIYHEEFTKCINAIGCDFQYSIESMQKDYDRFLGFSLTHVMTGAPVWLTGEGSTEVTKKRFAMFVIDAFKNGNLKFPEIVS